MALTDTALLRTQIGVQTNRATAVTPTVEVPYWDGQPEIQPIVESESFKQAGTLAPAVDARVTKRGGGVTLPLIPTWEQAHYFLDAAFGAASAVDNGDGTYTREYLAPTSAAPSVPGLTVIHGSAEGVVKAIGALAKSLGLTADGAEHLKLNWEGIAYDTQEGSLASLTAPSVTPIMGHQGKLYLDAWTGTIGTTEVTAAKFSCELSVDFQAENVHGCAMYPAGVRYGTTDGGLRISLDYEGAASDLTAILGATDQAVMRQVRLKWTYNTWSLTVDFAGAYASAPKMFADNEGVVSADLELAPMYHPTIGTWLKITLTNGVA